jgi:predicted esterase
MAEDVKIILLGFSQGCATQMRWITREFPGFDHLILWAGLLPEDLDYTPYKEYFSKKNLMWVYGNEDEFLKEKHISWHLKFMREQSLNFDTIEFEGKHVINRKVLHDVFEKIKDK